MTRVFFGMAAFVVGAALISSPGLSQPPGGPGGKDKGKDGKGPPRFELGQLFPPQMEAELKLTPAQEKDLDALKKEVKTRLDKILTDEQKKTIENFRPRGPGGPGGPGGKGPDDKFGKGGDKDKNGGPPPFEN